MAKDFDSELATNIKAANTKRMHFAFVAKGASDGALRQFHFGLRSPDETQPPHHSAWGWRLPGRVFGGEDGARGRRFR